MKSSRSETLLSPSPLRTVLVTFTTYGSSRLFIPYRLPVRHWRFSGETPIALLPGYRRHIEQCVLHNRYLITVEFLSAFFVLTTGGSLHPFGLRYIPLSDRLYTNCIFPLTFVRRRSLSPIPLPRTYCSSLTITLPLSRNIRGLTSFTGCRYEWFSLSLYTAEFMGRFTAANEFSFSYPVHRFCNAFLFGFIDDCENLLLLDMSFFPLPSFPGVKVWLGFSSGNAQPHYCNCTFGRERGLRLTRIFIYHCFRYLPCRTHFQTFLTD